MLLVAQNWQSTAAAQRAHSEPSDRRVDEQRGQAQQLVDPQLPQRLHHQMLQQQQQQQQYFLQQQQQHQMHPMYYQHQHQYAAMQQHVAAFQQQAQAGQPQQYQAPYANQYPYHQQAAWTMQQQQQTYYNQLQHAQAQAQAHQRALRGAAPTRPAGPQKRNAGQMMGMAVNPAHSIIARMPQAAAVAAVAGDPAAAPPPAKKKKKKKAAFPKRPESLFLIFARKHRPRLRQEQPGLSFSDMSKLLGKLWRAASDEEKEEVAAVHALQRRRFENDVQRLMLLHSHKMYTREGVEAGSGENRPGHPANNATTLGGGGGGGAGAITGVTALKRPKRPTTAYLYFTQHGREKLRKENPDLSFSDMGRGLGELWRSLSAEEKAPYYDMHKADRERYEKEEAEWKRTLLAAGANEEEEEESATGLYFD